MLRAFRDVAWDGEWTGVVRASAAQDIEKPTHHAGLRSGQRGL